MIDIHAHLLPYLDDGAPNDSEAIEMARAAVDEGFHAIIATPHHQNGQYINSASEVKIAVARLQEQLKDHAIPLTVHPGQEVRGYADLLQDFERGELLTLADSSYLLLEFPSDRVPKRADEWIHELSIKGINVIIAHPERNKELANSMERMTQLVEVGALAQVTSHSITGAFGRTIQKVALTMCRNRLVHFVATDAHNRTMRSFAIQQAYSLLSKEIGQQWVEEIMHNAERIVRNETITYEEPRVAKKKPWFFFGR